MYDWSVDEEKLKKGNPEGYRTWTRHKGNVQKAVNFLLQNQWVNGGKIYVRQQSRGFINETPIIISVTFKEKMPKYKYVAFGFILDEEIAPTISVIDQSKAMMKDFSNLRLVGEL